VADQGVPSEDRPTRRVVMRGLGAIFGLIGGAVGVSLGNCQEASGGEAE